MKYTEIEFDEHNIYKNEVEHNVCYWEIEECFENVFVVLKNKKRGKHKNRRVVLGRTNAGRYLFLVVLEKGGGLIRPISARDMSDAERKYYVKQTKNR